jgi:hypothetical protein
MKLPNLVSKSHQSFASVFLAFSLFGFVFPHHATRVKQAPSASLRVSRQTHEVNLKASDRTWQTATAWGMGSGRKTDGSEPRFKNPRVHPGTPYNQGWWPDP